MFVFARRLCTKTKNSVWVMSWYWIAFTRLGHETSKKLQTNEKIKTLVIKPKQELQRLKVSFHLSSILMHDHLWKSHFAGQGQNNNLQKLKVHPRVKHHSSTRSIETSKQHNAVHVDKILTFEEFPTCAEREIPHTLVQQPRIVYFRRNLSLFFTIQHYTFRSTM